MELITADMLLGYLQRDKRLFEELLPELIRKLIISESTSSNVRIPGRSDIGVPGFDGTVQLNEATKHVAQGVSYWEFGTQIDSARKVKSDYDKRTAETDEQVRKNTAFYLVTPRRWNRKSTIYEWEASHNDWEITKVYDGIALAEWINSQPNVCAWLMSEFGDKCFSFCSVKEAWNQFSDKTSPSFVESFFLYERDDLRERLIAIMNQKNIIKVKSDFFYDSLGFVLAAVLSDPSLCESVIVINDYETYKYISNTVSNKILILNFYCDSDLSNNNHTIICYGKEACGIEADISLSPRARRQVEHILMEMGIEKEKVSDLYKKTHGNLRALIRRIPGSANEPVPKWANKPDLHLLYPLLFLESISRSNDCELVESLTNEKYEVIEEKYIEFARSEDSPVKIVGDFFVIVNYEEVWDYLQPRPEDKHFQRLINTLFDIIDGKLNVDRFHIRRGSIEQQLLSIVVWYSYENSDSSKYAHAIDGLLNKRFQDDKVIYDNLHVLAEAAPDKTLRAIETDLENTNSYIYYALDNNCYSSILMAIEELSLFESTAYQACLILYKLARIDKEYYFSNTPYNSLSNVLMLLNFHSALPIDTKTVLLKKCLSDNSRWGSLFVSETICKDHYYRCERIGKKEGYAYESLTYKKYYDIVFDIAVSILNACNESGYIEPVIELINHYWIFTSERLAELADLFNSSAYDNEDVVRINSLLRHKNCYVDNHESRQGYTKSIRKWILHTTVDDPIKGNAWAFSDYYHCPESSLANSIMDLDEGKTYTFRVKLLRKIRKQCDCDEISQLASYMDNSYGWGCIINSLSEPVLLERICIIARKSRKYVLLAGCMDHLRIEEFISLLQDLNDDERKHVLPLIYRRDFLKEPISEEDLILFWSNKIMKNYDNNEYRTMLKYNPYGLLYYCRVESEKNVEGIINTILEVFNSIVEFEPVKKNNKPLGISFIPEIVGRVDKVFYSTEWALLCMKLQALRIMDNYSDGINRYLFKNPQRLLKIYDEAKGFNIKFKLPICAFDNYAVFKEFIDYLVTNGKRSFAARIISFSLKNDKEFPLVVMKYLEDHADSNFDIMIASSISSSYGFEWTSDGTSQRKKAANYSKIAKAIDANYFHTKNIFMTLSRIYLKESYNEDIYGEID